MPTQKKVKPPQLTIERVLWDSETGKVTAVALHDESRGMALFCQVVEVRFHGFNTPKKV